MFKLMLQLEGGKQVRFVAPGWAEVKEKYESKWLAEQTAIKLNKGKQFRKSGTIVVSHY